MAMNDDLLKRADNALLENQIIRAECLGNLMHARAASARIKRTLQWARADRANTRQLGSETADRVAAALENREGYAVLGSSDET